MSGQDALFVAVRAMGFGEIGAKTLLKIVLDRGKDAFGEKSRGEEKRGARPGVLDHQAHAILGQAAKTSRGRDGLAETKI